MFKMLLPDNSAKKQVDFLIGCFFLASIVFFFTSGRVNFAYGVEYTNENIQYVNFDEAYGNAQSAAVNRELGAHFKRVLADEDIFVTEILINTNISDKYSISINEIRLVFENEAEDFEDLSRAIHIIQKEVGDRILISGEFKSW